MKLLASFFTWLLSRLFGGDKTAELAESKGELENEEKSDQGALVDAASGKAISDRIDSLPAGDALRELRNDFPAKNDNS